MNVSGTQHSAVDAALKRGSARPVGLGLCVACLCMAWSVSAHANPQAPEVDKDRPQGGVWERSTASSSVQEVAHWVQSTGDHQGLPYVLVDKIQAQVWVFDRRGQWVGSAPALLGLTRGDVLPPGSAHKPLLQLTPEERITPAGRFVAELGRNVSGQTILWVDYEQAISLHPVRSLNARERRLERLASPTAEDNRISYGCINVPVLFWRHVVLPTFEGTPGIVYVLPDSAASPSVLVHFQSQPPWPLAK